MHSNVLNNLKSKPYNPTGYIAQQQVDNIVIKSAEVFDIILDNSHIDYVDEKSIGEVKFKFITNNNVSVDSLLNSAKPIDPNNVKYPIKHEIILIIQAPNALAGINNNSKSYYYTNAIGVWGLTNSNALPYASAVAAANKVIKFGQYFKTSPDIPKLIPDEGDIIISGRYGNFIRFTGVQPGSKSMWNNGTTNSPVIVISTDNSVAKSKRENINTDASSIYVVQSAKINFTLASKLYKSYKTKPVNTEAYTGDQILLNSGRIAINSKSDHIFLSSVKTISISANESINFDSNGKFIFGNSQSAERCLLGESTNDIILKLINTVNSIATACSSFGVTIPPTVATDVAKLLSSIKSKSNLSIQLYSS